jgi:hypothetical protein
MEIYFVAKEIYFWLPWKFILSLKKYIFGCQVELFLVAMEIYLS